MSYTDLLQSYQDRVTAMAQNENSVGDYLLNKAQEKMNSYLEETGIPAQIGGVIEQIGILSNNSAVKTLLEKSGIKGVADQQIESLNRTVGDLKGQIQAFGEKASAAIDQQVSNAKQLAQPLLTRTQEGIDAARGAETQVREGVQAARQLSAQAQDAATELGQRAQGAATELGERAQGAATELGERAQGAATELGQRAQGAATELGDRVPTLDEALANLRTQAPRGFLPENLPEGGGEMLENIVGPETSRVLGGLPPRGARATSGVSEEPNVRPSQIDRNAPEFETGTQQLPQAPTPQAPTPQAPTPQVPTPQVPRPSEIEAAPGPENRPTGYEPPEEMVERPPPPGEMSNIRFGPENRPEDYVEPELEQSEQAVSSATKTEQAISTTAKVGTTLEETTGELPGIGEVGEVLGALLQIGSLIASAFKPHESTPAIQTPISGFGFGAMNQFGVGGSSIV